MQGRKNRFAFRLAGNLQGGAACEDTHFNRTLDVVCLARLDIQSAARTRLGRCGVGVRARVCENEEVGAVADGSDGVVVFLYVVGDRAPDKFAFTEEIDQTLVGFCLRKDIGGLPRYRGTARHERDEPEQADR